MNEETKNYWMGTTFMWICGLLFVMGGLQSMGWIPDPDKQRTLDLIHGRVEWDFEKEPITEWDRPYNRHEDHVRNMNRWPSAREANGYTN